MATPVFLLFVLGVQVITANEIPEGREGIIDTFSNGMKFAQNFLGSESVAHKVAEFVVRAFQPANKPHNRRPPSPFDAAADASSAEHAHDNRPNYNLHEAQNPFAPLKHLVHLFGLQPSQISAVAVNAIVFVAQMISTFLAGPRRPSRPLRSEDPTSWILNKNSKQLQELIAAAKNESLTNLIEDSIRNQAPAEETTCIRLLMCKITPFINKMQKVVFDKEDVNATEKARGAEVMYRHLPSRDEINDRSDFCEQRHRDCDLNE